MRALVDEQHAALARAARPLVGAATVEVGLDVGQVDVEQAETLRAVEQRQDAAPRASAQISFAGNRSPTVLDMCVKARTFVRGVIAFA